MLWLLCFLILTLIVSSAEYPAIAMLSCSVVIVEFVKLLPCLQVTRPKVSGIPFWYVLLRDGYQIKRNQVSHAPKDLSPASPHS